MDNFDHPCKQTCSGWRQGFEKGLKQGEEERERSAKITFQSNQRKNAEIAALTTGLKQCEAERDRMRAALEWYAKNHFDDTGYKARKALEGSK